MLTLLYVVIALSVPIAGCIYCKYTYGRKTRLEKDLQQIINNYHSHYL